MSVMDRSSYKKSKDGPGGLSLSVFPEPPLHGGKPHRLLRLKSVFSTLLAMVFTAYLLASCLYLLPAFSASIRYRDEAPVVAVKNGSYAGIHSAEYNQDFFLGIPYAKVMGKRIMRL
ncbi:hypothetical protein N0V92_005580 [Colletotrichum tropicale]|nr:hypothetical protein N0V92_005580 [Colletotrichum tropicale]